MSGWSGRGMVVLWGQRGLYRVLAGDTSPAGWVYLLQSITHRDEIHHGVRAWECRELPTQPEGLEPLPEPTIRKRRTRHGRP